MNKPCFLFTEQNPVKLCCDRINFVPPAPIDRAMSRINAHQSGAGGAQGSGGNSPGGSAQTGIPDNGAQISREARIGEAVEQNCPQRGLGGVTALPCLSGKNAGQQLKLKVIRKRA